MFAAKNWANAWRKYVRANDKQERTNERTKERNYCPFTPFLGKENIDLLGKSLKADLTYIAINVYHF